MCLQKVSQKRGLLLYLFQIHFEILWTLPQDLAELILNVLSPKHYHHPERIP